MKYKMKLNSKANGLTPRQKQEKFRSTMKKGGCVAGGILLSCFFVGSLGLAGKSDYKTEIAMASEPKRYVPIETESESFSVETRTEDAILVGMEGDTLTFRTEDGNEWTVTGTVTKTLKFGDIHQTADDITDDVILGWE